MSRHAQTDPPHSVGDILEEGEMGAECATEPETTSGVGSCLSDLLKANLSRFTSMVRGEVDIAQIGDGPDRTIEWLLGSIGNARTAGLFTFSPAKRVLSTGKCRAREVGIDRKSFMGSLRKLSRVRRGRERPMVLCLLDDQFASTDPEWLLPRLQEHLRPNDLLIFDSLLWPAGAEEDESTASHPDEVPQSNPLCVREEGLEPGQYDFRLEVVPRQTRWGVIYKIQKKVCVQDDSAKESHASRISGQAGRLLNIGSSYRYSGYQLERYLQEHGMYIADLAMCDEHDHALVATRPE